MPSPSVTTCPPFLSTFSPFSSLLLCGWLIVSGKESVYRHLQRGCSDRSFLIGLGASSALVAILFAGLDPYVIPWGGLDRYFTRAVNIVTNGVFGYGTTPMAIFPPGYSFLLLPSVLILGDNRWAFFLTNLALLLGFAFVLRAALEKLGAERRLANLLALLFVLYPNRILSAIIPFSDVPFSLLYGTAFLLLLVRLNRSSGIGSALTIGFLGGIATLVRSNGLVTFFPLLLGVFASAAGGRPRAFRETLAAALVFLAVLTPWTIRNYTTFGRFVPVSLNAGINIAIGNNPSHPVTHNTYIDSVWSQEGRWKQVGGEGWNEAQRDSFFAALGRSYILDHPWDFLSRAVTKSFLTFRADSYTFGEMYTYTSIGTGGHSLARNAGLPAWCATILGVVVGTGMTLLLVLNNTIYYLIVGLSLWFLFAKGKTSPIVRWVIILLLLGILAMTVVTFGLSRYKEPLGIVLAIYCAGEVIRIKRGVWSMQ